MTGMRNPLAPADRRGNDQSRQKGTPVVSNLSHVQPTTTSPWGTYLAQVDRVAPYLGSLARWSKPSAAQAA